jgi:thiosulfate dehydrogenase [quinone] large subunit
LFILFSFSINSIWHPNFLIMNDSLKFSRWQIAVLAALRFLIGWHLLYEGIYKLIHPEWSSLAFLSQSQWILSGFAKWIMSSDGILNTVDFLNTWGLIAIGLGLILGLFTRTAAIAGTLLLMLYYLMNPPLIGHEASVGVEGNYLVVNKTLIEAVTLLLLAAFPAVKSWGLDSIIRFNRKKS